MLVQKIPLRLYAAASALLILGSLVVAPVIAHASTTFSVVDGTLQGVPLAGTSSSDTDGVMLDVDAGHGLTLMAKSQSDIGINRLFAANSPSLPFGDSNTVLSALSFWGENLVATGLPGAIPFTVSFAFEGSYVGRTCGAFEAGCNPDNPSSSFGNAIFGAVSGRIEDVFLSAEDGPILLQTNNGTSVLQGLSTSLPAGNGLLGFTSVCPEDDGEDGCDPFAADTEHSLEFVANPGEEFFILSNFFVGNLAQGETVNGSVRLTGLFTEPGIELTSQSGKVVKLGDGNFGLARNAIPEPATWAMLLVGFGSLGAVLRRRRAQFVSGVVAEAGSAVPFGRRRMS